MSKGTLVIVVAAIAIVVFLMWRSRGPLMPESLFRVEATESGVKVTDPQGETKSVLWTAITKVEIRTTDDGPASPDVFWGLHSDGKDPVVFPGGATGEQELIKALNDHLPGFRDSELIRAMGSTSNAYFVLWEPQPVGSAQ